MLALWRRARCGPVVLLITFMFLHTLWATTHWVTTDDGRIVARVSSSSWTFSSAIFVDLTHYDLCNIFAGGLSLSSKEAA